MDILQVLFTLQFWFALAIAGLAFLGFPFLPVFAVHFVYRKWIRFSRFKWLRVVCIALMIALAILGMYFILAEYERFSDTIYNAYANRLGFTP